jgi:hypothetical protein
MAYQPLSRKERREQVIDALSGAVPGLTNWEENTVNWVIADAFAAEWYDYDHVALAVQLSGWVATAGGPVDTDDLRDLGIDPEPVDMELLNSMMDDSDLDALASQIGITRIPGSRAKGEVVFGTIEQSVTIPAETVLSTSDVTVDGESRTLEFETTGDVTSGPGQTTVSAPIRAAGVGTAYNVGAGTITSIINGPGGIEGVTNPEPTSGGEGPETNDELRTRVMNAPTETSYGGTTDGIRGAIVSEIDGIERDDVNIIEHHDPPGSDPGPYGGMPYAEVVVDGGVEDNVLEVIDDAKPCAVGHELVRPTETTIDITATAYAPRDAADISVSRVRDTLKQYISDLGIGEDLWRDQVIEHIMDADEDIINIDPLTITADGATVGNDYTVGPREVARAGTISISADSYDLDTDGGVEE